MEDNGLEIRFEDVTCGYRDSVVFRRLNCTFRQGEAVCVLGSNGVGKTTLFKTLLRQIPLLGGQILVDGVPLERIHLEDLAQVMAYVPQVRDSACNFTVLDMVMMGRSAYLPVFGAPGARERDRAMETLAFLGMENFASRSYALLSGGALMQQSASRWYFRASVAADAMILLTILGGTPVLGPGLVHIILSYVGDAVQWILGCLLFCAFGAVMRAAGKKAALEWVLLAVWSVSCILPILSALMGVNDVTAQQAAQLTTILYPLGCIALLLDAFRAQKESIRLEGDNT